MTKYFSDEEIEEILNRNPLTKEYHTDNGQYEVLKNFEIRDDDVFLLGFPKSGTTWAQEMIWIIANDFNYEGAKVFIDERFPVLEMGIQTTKDGNPAIKFKEYHWNSMKFIEAMKSPRFIKSHMGPNKLPIQIINGEKKAKIIYVVRNIKDVCVSLHHYFNNIKMSSWTLDDTCKIFINDINPGGKYWESVLYFWNRRNDDNVLFIKYEEMKQNLLDVIQKVAKFFNKTLTKEKEDELIKWLHIDSFKNNSAINHENMYNNTSFIRKGKVGGHKSEMSTEMISKFDLWIKESLTGSDYQL